MKKAILIVSIVMATSIGTVLTLSQLGVFGNSDEESVGTLYEGSVTRNTMGANSDIKKLKITEGVSDIEDGSFSDLSSLKTIKVDKDNNSYASDDGLLYNKDYSELLCVPQNASSVKNIKSSCVGYSEHALDGLTNEEKVVVTQAIAKNLAKAKAKEDKENEKALIAQTINENNNKASNNGANSEKDTVVAPKVIDAPPADANNTTNSNKAYTFAPRYKVNENTSAKASGSTTTQKSSSSFTPRTKVNNSGGSGTSNSKPSTSANKVQNSASVSNNNTNTVSNVSNINMDSSEFQKYVYQEDGETCFKYTGTGQSTIVIPEGVTRIDGFTEDQHSFNKEITSVVIPSTVEAIMCSNMYYDGNFYSVLYQCVNLKSVIGGNVSYQCYGNYVMRPGGIGIWSPNEKYRHDLNDYNNVDQNRLANDILSWTRSHR